MKRLHSIWPRIRLPNWLPLSVRLMLWPFLICSLFGSILLFEPVEDLLHGLRNMARAHSSDRQVVVVGLDDRTVTALGSGNFSRVYYARLIDNLFALGARRVFFDSAFSFDLPGTDAFATAITRHSGHVFLGTLKGYNNLGHQTLVLGPVPQLRKVSGVVSLNGAFTPFYLAAALPYEDRVGGRLYPSMSAMLANRPHEGEDYYLPDFSIQVSTIPTVSFLDVVNGKADRRTIAGRDVVIGAMNQEVDDFHKIVGQGWVPGVYFHAIGAQTLKAGKPSDFGFWPPLLLAVALGLGLFQLRSQRWAAGCIAAGFVLQAAVIPLAADAQRITCDYVAGLLFFAVAAYRSTTQRARQVQRRHNEGSLLPNLIAFLEDETPGDQSVIAMKMRNYPAIRAVYGDTTGHAAMRQLAASLDLFVAPAKVYQADDTLYWLAPYLAHWQLNDHLEGLATVLQTQLVVEGQRIDPQFTFGVEHYPGRAMDERLASALHAADTATVQRLLWHNHSEGSEEKIRQDITLMGDLDRAMDDGSITVAYQPQIDTHNGEISGVEALVRWTHPELGPISPEVFVAAAEQHHRIRRLTKYVIRQALRETAPCLAEIPALRVAVNLSGALLETAEFLKEIEQLLAREEFPPHNLTIEITETTRFDGHPSVIRALKALASRGVRISIDDYGTGNATLEYVKLVPVHEVKIDRQFITNIIEDTDNQVLVSSTISMAHSLGLSVVAEGIEDAATGEWLRKRQCDSLQGYYFSRPVPIAELHALIHRPQRQFGRVNK